MHSKYLLSDTYIYLLLFFQKNPFDFRPSQDSFNEKFFSYLNVDDIAKYLGTKCVFVDAGIYSGFSFLLKKKKSVLSNCIHNFYYWFNLFF